MHEQKHISNIHRGSKLCTNLNPSQKLSIICIKKLNVHITAALNFYITLYCKLWQSYSRMYALAHGNYNKSQKRERNEREFKCHKTYFSAASVCLSPLNSWSQSSSSLSRSYSTNSPISARAINNQTSFSILFKLRSWETYL